MKPLRARLQEARKRLSLPWEVLERDYLLSWILAGIGKVDSLRDTLVFKGGTALKKCYFGDYRFSEDLDFSGIEGVPSGGAMERAVRDACGAAAKLLEEYAPVEIHCERYTERDPHPGGQEAFAIRARFPWQRQPQTRVMIETAIDEKILKPAQRRKLIHEYGEPLEAEVRVYAPEEILAEKLRAILQHVQKLEERGWSRSRARDYYDLWRMLRAFREQMDFSDFRSLLRAKCAVRKVTFAVPEDFFQDRMLAYVGKTWDQWLGPLVPRLPTFDAVIGELRLEVTSLLSTGTPSRPASSGPRPSGAADSP
jgi:predicted nucleotidyltransferase component of viral defense system